MHTQCYINYECFNEEKEKFNVLTAEHKRLKSERVDLIREREGLRHDVEAFGTARLVAAESGRAINVRFWNPREYSSKYDEFITATEAMLLDLAEHVDVSATEEQAIVFDLLDGVSGEVRREMDQCRLGLETLLGGGGGGGGGAGGGGGGGSCVVDVTSLLKSAFCSTCTPAFVERCTNACVKSLKERKLEAIDVANVRSWVPHWIRLESWLQLATHTVAASSRAAAAARGPTRFDKEQHSLLEGSLAPGEECFVLIPASLVDGRLVKAWVRGK